MQTTISSTFAHLLFFCAFFCSNISAQPLAVNRVADLYDNGAPAFLGNVSGLVKANNRAIYAASDRTGTYVLGFDGTAHTYLYNAANGAATISDLASCGSFAVFWVFNSDQFYELWRTDGTLAGTYRLQNFHNYPFSGQIPIKMLAAESGEYLFALTDFSQTNTVELWRSVGTTSGTARLRTIPAPPSLVMTAIDVFATRNGERLLTVNFDDNSINFQSQVYYVQQTRVDSVTTAHDSLAPPYYNGTQHAWDAQGVYFFTNAVQNGGLNYYHTNTQTDTVLIAGGANHVGQFAVLHDTLWLQQDSLKSYTHTTGFSPHSGRPFSGFIPFQNTLYFFGAATNSFHEALYRIENQQPVLFIDIAPSGNFQTNNRYAVFNNQLFFDANDGIHGDEVWRTNGTSAGTNLVADISPNANGSFPQNFYIHQNKLYFTARTTATGTELYTTNGTASGTVLLSDLNPGTAGSSPLFITDSSTNYLYFTAMTAAEGREIYRTDGTPTGTLRLRDTWAGTQSGILNNAPVCFVQQRLCFLSSYATSSNALWQTDGTSANTQALKRFDDNASSAQNNFMPFGNKLLFSAVTATGVQLFQTEGTAAATSILHAFNLPQYSSIDFKGEINGNLYMLVNQSSANSQLWKTDGTATGTVLVKNLSGQDPIFRPFIMVNGKGLFNINSPTTGEEPWVTDGTAAGTQLLKDVSSGTSPSYSRDFLYFNNYVYFTGRTTSSAHDLWRTDGTPSGTVKMNTIDTSLQNIVDVQRLTVFNGRLYFVGRTTTYGREIWSTDGQIGGSQLLKDLAIGATDGMGNADNLLLPAGNRLYFRSNYTTANPSFNIWSTDGTSAGTFLAKNLFSTDSVVANYWTNSAKALGNKVVFVAENPAYGAEIWVTDGTAVGTTLLKDICTGRGSSYTNGLFYFNGKVYFSSFDENTGRSLWQTDGTTAGTSLALNSYQGSDNMPTANYFALPDGFVFANADSQYGYEVWYYNTAADQFSRISDINPQGGCSNPYGFTFVNQDIYFTATDDSTGYEVYRISHITNPTFNTNEKNKHLTVFPNPTRGNTTIRVFVENPQTLTLYDAMGQLLKSEIVTVAGETTFSLPSLAAGIYFLSTNEGVAQIAVMP